MSSGNELRYRRSGDGCRDIPLLVLESGLSGTAEQWEWASRELAQSFPVVTYTRAGYGGSALARECPYSLSTAVADLAEVATREAGPRPVVLVGYSLGGYLAWQAASHMAGQVLALVVVDCSHPSELAHTGGIARLFAERDAALGRSANWLRAGFGSLMPAPAWTHSMPADIRDLVGLQAREPGTWIAARREWRAAREHAERTPFGPPSVPVLLMMSENMAEDRPALLAVHQRMAMDSPRGQFHVISGCNHDSVLSSATSARQIAQLINSFVTDIVDSDGSSTVAGMEGER